MQAAPSSFTAHHLFCILLTSALVATSAQPEFTPKQATSTDVIIIGAGMSGLAAASSLKKKGVNVIVLEARNRVGGRTYSISSSANGISFYADLGASWVHGISGNPLIPVAKAANVALQSKVFDDDNSQTYYADGKEVPDATDAEYEDLFGEFEDYLDALKEEDYDEDDPGLQSAVNGFIKEQGLTGELLRVFKYQLNTRIQHEYGGAISDLSLFLDGDEELPGGDKLVLGGYQNIPEYLRKGIDVRLSHQVTEINYSAAPSGSVTVKATAGGKSLSFSAPRVIVTLPIGVLKANVVKFTPALPAVNRGAIAAMGSGLLNKCILVFDKVFWDSKINNIDRIYATGDGAWEETLSLVPAAGLPVLYAFNAATYAEALEKKSDAATVAEAMAALRKIWPGAPDPTTYYVTRWKSDPFARGSYSYTTPKMEYEEVHTNVGKPVGGNRVRFAGEHTSVKYPATAHGAYLSGTSTACAILKELGKSC